MVSKICQTPLQLPDGKIVDIVSERRTMESNPVDADEYENEDEEEDEDESYHGDEYEDEGKTKTTTGMRQRKK